MKTLKRLALIAAFAVVPAFGQGNSVSGTWKVSGDVAGNPVNSVCTLKQDGNKLTGTCQTNDAKPSELTGEVQEKRVSWKYNGDYNGEPLTVSFSGSLDDSGSQLSGKIDVQPFGVSGDFTAKKD